MKFRVCLFTVAVISLTACSKEESPKTGGESLSASGSKVQNIANDIKSGKIFENAEEHEKVMAEFFENVPGLKEKVDELLKTVKENGPAQTSGIRKAADDAAACLPKEGGGGCPNVCVFAAAFAAAFACAWAEAHACATCGSGANQVTVCAQAQSSSCAWAFGYGFAYACTGGGDVAAIRRASRRNLMTDTATETSTQSNTETNTDSDTEVDSSTDAPVCYPTTATPMESILSN